MAPSSHVGKDMVEYEQINITLQPKVALISGQENGGRLLVLGEHQCAPRRTIERRTWSLDERYNRNKLGKAGKMGYIIGQHMGYAVGEHGRHNVGIVDLPPTNLGLLHEIIK